MQVLTWSILTPEVAVLWDVTVERYQVHGIMCYFLKLHVNLHLSLHKMIGGVWCFFFFWLY